MTFSAILDEQQSAFRSSLERNLTERYSFDHRQTTVATGEGFAESDWNQLADLGCMAAPFPVDAGGLGGGAMELMVIAEQFGRHLVRLPYLASVVLGGSVIDLGGNTEQRSALLPRIADGSLKLALAYVEPQARFDLHDVETRAIRVGTGWNLNGRKDVVLYGQSADQIVVVARTYGDSRDPEGLTLFLVPAESCGITIEGYRLHDGDRAASIRFDDVVVGDESVIDATDIGLRVLELAIDRATVFVCAEMLGSMWKMFETTLEYLKTREQFGQPLGSFQALQHRMVDMYTRCELATSSVHEVTQIMTSDPDNNWRRHNVSAAKYAVGEAARLVCADAIQLHGGIGMTMDHPAGHHFKRVTSLNGMFGDPDHHLDSFRK